MQRCGPGSALQKHVRTDMWETYNSYSSVYTLHRNRSTPLQVFVARFTDDSMQWLYYIYTPDRCIGIPNKCSRFVITHLTKFLLIARLYIHNRLHGGNHYRRSHRRRHADKLYAYM